MAQQVVRGGRVKVKIRERETAEIRQTDEIVRRSGNRNGDDFFLTAIELLRRERGEKVAHFLATGFEFGERFFGIVVLRIFYAREPRWRGTGQST